MKNKDYRLLSNQFSRKRLVSTCGGEKKVFSTDDKKSRTDLGNNNRGDKQKLMQYRHDFQGS